jgi:hypothetical protein
MIQVSAIVPVFNGESTIAAAIDSVLNQSFDATEYEPEPLVLRRGFEFSELADKYESRRHAQARGKFNSGAREMRTAAFVARRFTG